MDALGNQTSLAARGYWVNNVTQIDPGWDFMGIPVSPAGQNPPRAGGRNSWIEDGNFNHQFGQLSNPADPEILIIRGVAQKDGAVELLPWYKLPKGFTDLASGSTGAYTIALFDDQGQVLDQFGFDLSFELAHPPTQLEFQNIAFRVPFLANTREVQIQNSSTGQVLAHRVISANPPSVRILSPSGGETVITGSPVAITWEGIDPDGGSLSYDLFFSIDEGKNWFPLAIDIEDQSFVWDTAGFPVEKDYLLTIIATDGVLTSVDTSLQPFKVTK